MSKDPDRTRREISRREAIKHVLVGSSLGVLVKPVGAQTVSARADAKIVVTLLGTGSPDPDPVRFSAATLVQAGGMNFLFDAGRGSAIRLNQLKVPLGSLESVMLTHLHSDHVVGLPDIWLMGFINPNFGGRKGALRVVGPIGSRNLVDGLNQAYRDDVRIRIADQRVNIGSTGLEASEFDKDGVVFDRGGVRIHAFVVDHGDLVKPAYGYKIEYEGRSVLLSGDTKLDQSVIKNGMGVDLLIHEVAEAPGGIKGMPWVKDIMSHHTSAQECGIVFSATKPKLAVYTHLVLLNAPGTPALSISDLVAATRQSYSGPLVVGEDLMQFVVGDEVEVVPWPRVPR